VKPSIDDGAPMPACDITRRVDPARRVPFVHDVNTWADEAFVQYLLDAVQFLETGKAPNHWIAAPSIERKGS
jgi:hypothetical protein